MGAKIYYLKRDMTFSEKPKDKPVTDPKMTRVAPPVKNEPVYTMGRDVQVGDELKVWWPPYKDTVVEILPYSGPMDVLYRAGARRMIFAINKQGLTMENDEMYDVIGKNEEVCKTKEQKTHKCFFKTLGHNLEVGDRVEVTWSFTGDTIIGVKDYIGGLLNLMTDGAKELTFMNWPKSIVADNTKMFNVISRMGPDYEKAMIQSGLAKPQANVQGVSEDLLDRESEPIEYETPINDEEVLAQEGHTPPAKNGMEVVKYGDMEWRRMKRENAKPKAEIAIYEA